MSAQPVTPHASTAIRSALPFRANREPRARPPSAAPVRGARSRRAFLEQPWFNRPCPAEPICPVERPRAEAQFGESQGRRPLSFQNERTTADVGGRYPGCGTVRAVGSWHARRVDQNRDAERNAVRAAPLDLAGSELRALAVLQESELVRER